MSDAATPGFGSATITNPATTTSRYDQPAARGDQLPAALDHLTTRSAVRDRVDATRLAVVGHSMGGGGALEAAVPLTAWNTDETWPEVRTPTLLVGAERDAVAPVATHSIPFYGSLTSAPEKVYVELNEASHSAPTVANATLAKYTISWLKRFVDDDVRYSQFLCPGPTVSVFGAVSDYRSTCAI